MQSIHPRLIVLVILSATFAILSACSSPSEETSEVAVEAPSEVSTGAPAEMPSQPEVASTAIFEEGVPGGVVVNTLDMSAKVVAIDSATRGLTLMGPEGNEFEVTVGPEAVNFDQVQVGDMVNATLTEQLVIFMGDETSAQNDGVDEIVLGAAEGEQPAGLAAETAQLTGTVTAIDSENRTATLEFEDGSSKTIAVRDDIDLSQHDVGEKVVFQVTEMFAISVEKQ